MLSNNFIFLKANLPFRCLKLFKTNFKKNFLFAATVDYYKNIKFCNKLSRFKMSF